jgi:hypothetical protein
VTDETDAPDGLAGAAPPTGWLPQANAPSALVGAPILDTPSSSASARSPLTGNSATVAPATSPSNSPSILGGVDPNARGMRNNNPGNLEANSYTAAMPGYVGSDGRFAKFATPEAGIAALKRNLGAYAAKGISTPFDVASTWAPPSEKSNDPASYSKTIARELGVHPGDKINLSDPATQEKVAQAIAKVENGASGGSRGPSQSSGPMPTQNAEAAPVAASAASPQPGEVFRDEMKLKLLQGMFPQHSITPVEYDPWKLVPKVPTKVDVNRGVE